MKPQVKLKTELDDLETEDEWADFTADLLSLKISGPILKRLFTNPLGHWLDFSELLSGHDETVRKLEILQSECDGTLRVAWLDYPDLDRGYCMILFYVDSLGWNNLALYNKAVL